MATVASTSTSPRNGSTSTRSRSLPTLGLPPSTGAAGARRGRWGLRRARGPVHARPRVHARPAHRASGPDGLQPGGVVLRTRPPPPGAGPRGAGRDERRSDRVRQRAAAARRGRLHLDVQRRDRQRLLLRGRRLPGPRRAHRRLCGVHQQPALRRDARLRGRAGLLRHRVGDRPAGRRAGHRPAGAAAAQRARGGHGAPHRPGRRRTGARCESCSSTCATCRCPPSATAARSTCGRSPAASATSPTARASDVASATRSA